MWAALSYPMVMGVATVNKTKAWEEWTKASLANEARNYPTMCKYTRNFLPQHRHDLQGYLRD